MKKWLRRLHRWTDFLLPYTLILIVFLIVCEFFFVSFYRAHLLIFDMLDWAVIAVFASDLGFKLHRARTVPKFIKTSWLDIIATIPFFYVFRLFESIGILSRFIDSGSDVQHFLSAGLEANRDLKALWHAENAAREVSRAERLARFLRPLFRTPRLLKSVHFFEKPRAE